MMYYLIKLQLLIRAERLGIPQSSRDVFTLLAQANWIDTNIAETMKRMNFFKTALTT